MEQSRPLAESSSPSAQNSVYITEPTHNLNGNPPPTQAPSANPNQLEELHKRSVTLVIWYKAQTTPLRLVQPLPTFPFLQLSQFPSLLSSLSLTNNSFVDAYNATTAQWDQHMIETARLVVSEQRVLYKLRKSLLDDLAEEECPGLQEEIAAQPRIEQNGKHAFVPQTSSGPTKRRAPDTSSEFTPPNKYYIPDGMHQGMAKAQPIYQYGMPIAHNTDTTISALQHTPPKPLAVVKSVIHNILRPYRFTMKELVTKAGQEPLISPWIPKTGNGNMDMAFRNHAEKLAIPAVNGMPSLLLHELESETSATNQKQAENIAGIFSLHRHTVLLNTSGSGKTRLGLHGLCQTWGLYGVVQGASDGIGSGDFEHLMLSLDNSHDYSRANSIGSDDGKAATHMRQKVQHRVLQFLLARFLLLNLLIEEARKSERGLRPSAHRHLWVLLQARPTDMLNEDAFLKLSNALSISSIKDLEAQIEDEIEKLKSILEPVVDPSTNKLMNRPLYCFLDEIQDTTANRMGEFRSESITKKKRSLLRPIWQSMTQALDSTKILFILSGTAINRNSLEDVMGSSIFKFNQYIIWRDIGAFDDLDAQRQYIKRYLPGNQSAARQDFLKRAWGWCRGRYRSTASLVVFILAAGPYSPHKILNKFVENSTNFLPTDGEQWCADEPDIGNLYMEEASKWRFDKLNSQQLDVLCKVLYGQIVYGCYSLTAHTPSIVEDFIEYGFARTRSRKDAIGGEHVLDEPLPFMAMSNWLGENGRFSLLDCLRSGIGNHTPRKNAFEAYLAFYVHKAFEKTAILDSIFTFRSDFARRKGSDLSWQSEEFELVTVSIPAGTNEQNISVVTPSCGPSSNIGLLAMTDDEVLGWISENQERHPFCFPTDHAGPDLFFYVRSKATGRLLLIALQAKQHKDVDKPTLVQGVRTVTPSFFWKSKQVDEVSNCPSVVASRFCDALMKLEHRITIANARCPILRIFASWPADAKLKRTLDLKELKGGKATEVDEDNVDVTDPDEDPLATLHLDNFNENSRILARSWFENDAEQAVVAFAKDRCVNKDVVR